MAEFRAMVVHVCFWGAGLLVGAANLGMRILKAFGGLGVWFVAGGRDGRGFEVG